MNMNTRAMLRSSGEHVENTLADKHSGPEQSCRTNRLSTGMMLALPSRGKPRRFATPRFLPPRKSQSLQSLSRPQKLAK